MLLHPEDIQAIKEIVHEAVKKELAAHRAAKKESADQAKGSKKGDSK